MHLGKAELFFLPLRKKGKSLTLCTFTALPGFNHTYTP